MRLHSLRLEAIGPFVQPQQIDFDRLTESGLFLFEGPTGSGKSTILDAITFALYGDIAGEAAAKSRLHSDFDSHATPSVELEFSASGRRFRILRTPQHERPKRRGTGTTTEKHQVKLFGHSHTDGWQLLSSAHAEVADIVRREVGLSRDQFMQVVLLPQGEFARFLRADDDERRRVLTRLFDAERYDAIAAELQTRAKQVRADSERQLNEIRRLLAVAAEAGAATAEVSGEWTPESRTLLVDLAAHEEQLEAAARVSGEALASSVERQAHLERRMDAARKRRTVMRRWEGLKGDKRDLDLSNDKHQQDVARLERAETAEVLRPLRDLAAEAAASTAIARTLVEDLVSNANSRQCPIPVGDGSDLEQAAREVAQNAAQLGHLSELEAVIPARRQRVASEKATIEDMRDRMQSLHQRHTQLKERAEGVTSQIEGTSEEAAALPLAESDLARCRMQAESVGEVQRLRPLAAAAIAASQERIDGHQAAVDALQRMQEARIQGMTGELAALLVDGQPCAVCGSAEHPHPAAPVHADVRVTASDIDQAAERVTRALRERSNAEDVRRSVEAALQVAESQAGGQTPDTAVALVAAAERRVEAAREAEKQLALLRAEQRAISTERAETEEALASIGEEVIAREAKNERDASELGDDERRVTEAAMHFNSVSERMRSLEQEASDMRALASALSALRTAERHQSDAESTLAAHAREAGIDDLDEVNAAILPVIELHQLRREVREYQVRAASLAEQLSSPEFEGMGTAKLEDLMTDEAAATAAATQGQHELDQIRLRHTNDTERAKRFVELSSNAKVAAETWQRSATTDAPLIDLDKLVRGQAGNRRMTLTTYVLRYWFNLVITAANVRLATIAGGRYELRRSEAPAAKNERVGLGLTVMDRHTGVERSPKSLSGGETFYTSLALALGLADVVQAEAGGATLETLFVDEGFGSLDADTLDEVLDIIDGLRGRGRAVGIVSHVRELKERVPERLEIRRARLDGPSTVRVLA